MSVLPHVSEDKAYDLNQILKEVLCLLENLGYVTLWWSERKWLPKGVSPLGGVAL